MATNPTLTQQASGDRDNPVVTGLVTRARNGDRQAWDAEPPEAGTATRLRPCVAPVAWLAAGPQVRGRPNAMCHRFSAGTPRVGMGICAGRRSD